MGRPAVPNRYLLFLLPLLPRLLLLLRWAPVRRWHCPLLRNREAWLALGYARAGVRLLCLLRLLLGGCLWRLLPAMAG